MGKVIIEFNDVVYRKIRKVVEIETEAEFEEIKIKIEEQAEEYLYEDSEVIDRENGGFCDIEIIKED